MILIKSVLKKYRNLYYYKIFIEKCLYQLANIIFHSIIMLRFGETKVSKERFHAAKKPIKIWDVNVNNIVITKLVKTKTNSKYSIWYLDKAITQLVLIKPKRSEYVETFKVKDEDKKHDKLMCFCVDDERLLKKYKAICTKI